MNAKILSLSHEEICGLLAHIFWCEVSQLDRVRQPVSLSFPMLCLSFIWSGCHSTRVSHTWSQGPPLPMAVHISLELLCSPTSQANELPHRLSYFICILSLLNLTNFCLTRSSKCRSISQLQSEGPGERGKSRTTISCTFLLSSVPFLLPLCKSLLNTLAAS